HVARVSAAPRRRERFACAFPQPGAHGGPHERRVGVEIPAPHPAWLLRQPPRPFEAGLLRPAGRAGDLAGDHIERAAHTHHEGRTERLEMVPNPELFTR